MRLGAGNAGDPNSCQLGHSLQVAVLPNGHEPLANGVLKGGLLCVEHCREEKFSPRAARAAPVCGRRQTDRQNRQTEKRAA